MNLFEEVKNRASIVEVLNWYGLTPNRAGFMDCPFHHESRSSFRVYPNTNSFYCFSCNQGGDVITFIGLMENLSSLEAARYLANRYNIPVNGSGTDGARYKQEQAARIALNNWRNEAMQNLVTCYQVMREDYFNNLPRWGAWELEPLYNDLFVTAALYRDYVAYLIEELRIARGDTLKDFKDNYSGAVIDFAGYNRQRTNE